MKKVTRKIKPNVLAALEKLINHYLALDPKLQTRLHPLTNKQLFLEITDLGATFYIAFQSDRINIATQPSTKQEPDLIVRGRTIALWRLFQSNSNTFQLHLRDVKIIGDLHLAQDIKLFFHSIDIDWEEQLSHFTGDIFAHQFFRGLTALGQWQRKVRENFKLNLTEYLQEEARYFPLPEEVETFMQEIDTLRDDTERLAAKIERLYFRENA